MRFVRHDPKLRCLNRAFRNQTIAHSQSELTVTYPVGVFDAKTLQLKFVSALTVASTLPNSVAEDFARLISAVLDLLDEALSPFENVLRRSCAPPIRKSQPLRRHERSTRWPTNSGQNPGKIQASPLSNRAHLLLGP